MIFRQFQHEKGMTLVELLAALSLFAIIVTLTSSIFVQLLSSEERSNEKISLSQNTNVLISDLRNQYYNENSKICLHQANERIRIKKYTIINGDEQLKIVNNCITVDTDEPLEIKLITSNDAGKDVSIRTTWSKKDDLPPINITKPLSILEYPVDGVPNDNGEFVYHGDAIFPVNITNQENIHVKGNATFPNNIGIANKINLIIDENFYVENGFESTNKLYINAKNTVFKGPIKLGNQSEIIIERDAYFYGEIKAKTNSGQAYICVKGDNYFKNGKTEQDYGNLFRCPQK